MRYAIVSDIHGNLPAWNTVLTDITLHRVDRIICLGDVVGYGPQPAETLQSVYEHVHLMVLGNHDAVVAGRMAQSQFNDRARKMIEWTSAHLSGRAREFFNTLPLVLKGPTFRCTHGDFSDPAAFHYITTPEEARPSFDAVPEQLLFCGHSHTAELFVIGHSGKIHQLPAQDFTAEPSKRYIINVGSVGFPRGKDLRASYVLFDDVAQTIRFFRVPYDFEAFSTAAAQKGLGPEEVPLLRDSRINGAELARETLDFAPQSDCRASVEVLEQDVSTRIRKSTARWKWLTAFAVFVALILGGMSLILLHQHAAQKSTIDTNAHTPLVLPETPAFPVDIQLAQGLTGSCLPVIHRQSSESFSVAPYRIQLNNSQFQQVSCRPHPSNPTAEIVCLSSQDASAGAAFESPPIRVKKGTRIKMFAKIALSDNFEGAVNLVARELHGSFPTFQLGDVLLTKTFYLGRQRDEKLPVSLRGLPYQQGWMIAEGTFATKNAAVSHVQIEINAHFTGELLIGGLAAREP